MKVLAIDPGTKKSAMIIVDSKTLLPMFMWLESNEFILELLSNHCFNDDYDLAAIEMLQSYGTLIGKDVLFTAVWIGRFYEAIRMTTDYTVKPALVYRQEEKLHICKTTRAGDPQIRRALIDRFCTHDFRSGRGTKDNPDFFYGFKADIWASYAVALTYIETKMRKEQNESKTIYVQ